MNNDIERKDFWEKELPRTKSKKWDDNDLERAFNSARKLYQEKLPQYETFYDYKKSLIKK
jgi:hypothetical protein